MKIHYCAMFDDKEMSYHGEFEVQATPAQIREQKDRVVSAAVGFLKKKCEEEFNADFEKLKFFEVYFYEDKEEVQIFKKIKQ